MVGILGYGIRGTMSVEEKSRDYQSRLTINLCI